MNYLFLIPILLLLLLFVTALIFDIILYGSEQQSRISK